jgi:NuA3 HAT complex component NTO1
VDKRRFRLECSVCKEKKGACIQCTWKGCKVSAHVSCALGPQGKAAGFNLTNKEDKKKFFCPEHKDN